MDTNARKFRWFWAWQDSQEEAWLQSMSQQGLHLQRVPFAGIYDFEQSEPGDFVYRLDFKESNKDLQDYLQIFADAGWEYIGRMNGWQYFRKEADGAGENPEIFTDADSKVKKYERLLTYLLTMLPVYLLVFIPLWEDFPGWFTVFISIFFVVLTILYGVAILKIERRIKELKAL